MHEVIYVYVMDVCYCKKVKYMKYLHKEVNKLLRLLFGREHKECKEEKINRYRR